MINENFTNPYTISQNKSNDGDCPNNGGWQISTSNSCTSCTGTHLYINSENNNCRQNATAILRFTPTSTTVNIDFDYLYRQQAGTGDSFRVYLFHDEVLNTRVGGYLVSHAGNGTSTFNTSFSNSRAVIPGTRYSIRFEYISNQARYASVDNVVINEITPGGLGRGYIGNDINSQ